MNNFPYMKYILVLSVLFLSSCAWNLGSMKDIEEEVVEEVLETDSSFYFGGIKYKNGSVVKIVLDDTKKILFFDTDEDNKFNNIEVPLSPIEINKTDE